MYFFLITVRFESGLKWAMSSRWGKISVAPGDSRMRIMEDLIEEVRLGCLEAAPWVTDSDVVILQFTLEPDEMS